MESVITFFAVYWRRAWQRNVRSHSTFKTWIWCCYQGNMLLT